MKKKYRLEVRQLSKDELAYFERIGCKIGKFYVEVFDDCREWDTVRKIIYRHSQDPQSIVWDVNPIFTEKELMRAPYLSIICNSYGGGYPQPENDWKYMSLTFGIDNPTMLERSPDTIDVLIEHHQMAPFRFSREPNWGKRNKGFTGVFWKETYVFVNNRCRELVFAPFGVKMLNVIKNRSGQPLETVFQLDPEVSSEPLDTRGFRYFDTPKKHRVFISSIYIRDVLDLENSLKSDGFYPPFVLNPQTPCCWTQEYFAPTENDPWVTISRDIVISHDVYMKIREYKFTGLDYIPMREW